MNIAFDFLKLLDANRQTVEVNASLYNFSLITHQKIRFYFR